MLENVLANLLGLSSAWSRPCARF